ncbi:MAG: hypothetical protein WC869_15480 [Phycisphaerae bacterium]|jgi:hypothetical protein
MDTDTKATSVRNRLWLARYGKAIYVVGILMLIGGGVLGGFEVAKGGGWLLAYTLSNGALMSLNGFLALGWASLLRYVLGARQQPGWVLEHVDIGLYLMAALRMASCMFWFCFQTTHIPYFRWYMMLEPGIQATANALILVALGLTIKRVLPVIEESRTLV